MRKGKGENILKFKTARISLENVESFVSILKPQFCAFFPQHAVLLRFAKMAEFSFQKESCFAKGFASCLCSTCWVAHPRQCSRPGAPRLCLPARCSAAVPSGPRSLCHAPTAPTAGLRPFQQLRSCACAWDRCFCHHPLRAAAESDPRPSRGPALNPAANAALPAVLVLGFVSFSLEESCCRIVFSLLLFQLVICNNRVMFLLWLLRSDTV